MEAIQQIKILYTHYNKSGRYSVTLTASNANGSNSLTKSSYIAVSNVLNGPVTSFSASPTSGKAPLTVRFTDQSTGSPTSWKWTFGDGSNSTDKNPVHIYNKSGLYSVTLTASNANGSNALTKTGYIAVSSVLATPVTNFSASSTSGSVPLTVSFTDQSTGSPTSWKWTFGDGNASTEKNPVHTYNKSGLYSVTLTASNANGSNALTKTSYIAVSNSLVAAFSASQLQDLYRLVSVLLTRAQDHQLHGNGLLEMEILPQKRILYTYTIKQDNILLV